jgi:hypothetical protein
VVKTKWMRTTGRRHRYVRANDRIRAPAKGWSKEYYQAMPGGTKLFIFVHVKKREEAKKFKKLFVPSPKTYISNIPQ